MNLQRKKLAFMAIVNRIKGFVRSAVGTFSLNLSDCVDSSSLINLSVSGNTAQSGTPSPDNPVEVEGVGDYYNEIGKYKIPINVHSMNMLNFSKFTKVAQGVSIDTADKTITIPWLSGNSQAIRQGTQPCTVGKYTFALTATRYPVRLIIRIYDSNNTALSTGVTGAKYLSTYGGFYTQNSTGIFNFEVTNPDVAKISFGFAGLTDWGEGNSTTLSELMFLTGTYNRTTLPDYEDYQMPVNANICLDKLLYKAEVHIVNNSGVVVGYEEYYDELIINYDNRTAKRINNVKAVDMRSLNWIYVKDKYMYALISDGKTKNELNGYAGYCNYYPLSNVGWNGTPDKHMQIPSNYNADVRNVLIYDSDYTSAADFKAYLETLENPTIYYILKEPEEELISLDWNALPNTVKGTTIITAESNILPTEMSAEYYAKKA